MSFFKAKMLNTAAVVAEAQTDTGSVAKVEFDGEALAHDAVTLGQDVSAGTELAMEQACKGKDDWQKGPINVLFGLKTDFTDEEDGECLLDTFAEPDSDTGNNPDKFKMPVTDTSGKTAMRPTTFYHQFVAGTKAGSALTTELAYLKRANNLEAIKDGIPSAITEMTQSAREDRITAIGNRLTNMRNAYKKAMALYFQLQRVSELTVYVDKEGNVNADPALNVYAKQGSVGVDFVWITDDKGEDTSEVSDTPQPIVIWEQPGVAANGTPRPIKNQKKISVGAFLKFDAAKASENGGTWKALLKTVERAPKAPDGTVKPEEQRIATVDTFLHRMTEVARFMDEMQSDADPKNLGKLYQLLKHKDADELIATVVGFRNYLDDVVDELGLEAKYLDIVKKDKEMGNAKDRKAA